MCPEPQGLLGGFAGGREMASSPPATLWVCVPLCRPGGRLQCACRSLLEPQGAAPRGVQSLLSQMRPYGPGVRVFGSKAGLTHLHGWSR